MSFKIVAFLVLLFRVYADAYSPVVIVPGTGGSRLEAKLDGKPTKPAWYCYSSTSSWFTLWLRIQSLLPWQINCWVDNIRLEWNMKDMSVSPPKGVQVRVPGFSLTETMETLDTLGLIKYMKPLVDHLRSMGYKNGKDLYGAPYDFRYSPENLPGNYHANLGALIEKAYTSNDNAKVTIISHSYGCPVTQYFLSKQTKEWKDKYIKQWIPLSGIFGGSKTIALLYSSGHTQGIPHAVVSPLVIRGEQRTSTSNLWMLPSLAAWPLDEIIAETKQRTYRMSDIDDFLKDIGYPNGVAMRHHISNSSHFMSEAPGVPIHCFYGFIPNSTIDRLHFDDNFPNVTSKIINGDGDGTVNLNSLKLCEKFAHLQKEVVSVREIKGKDHNGVLSDQTVLAAISNLLL